jgi:hypothetical protein
MNDENSALLVWVGATMIVVMIVVGFGLPALLLPVGAAAVPIARGALALAGVK